MQGFRSGFLHTRLQLQDLLFGMQIESALQFRSQEEGADDAKGEKDRSQHVRGAFGEWLATSLVIGLRSEQLQPNLAVC